MKMNKHRVCFWRIVIGCSTPGTTRACNEVESAIGSKEKEFDKGELNKYIMIPKDTDND